MFRTLRFLTAGESHGPKITVILEGIPAGLPIDKAAINEELARRQGGFGRGGRMKIEKDVPTITAGVVAGKTTGAPIAMELLNLDYKNWADKEIPAMTIPRPGHADLTGAIKYGHADLRLSLERSSARETAARVCAGAICKQLLGQFGIQIRGYVVQLGTVTVQRPKIPLPPFPKGEFSLPDSAQEEAVEREIHQCMKDKDTLGGVFEVVALNVPPGLGSYVHWDRRLDAQIGMAMLSIPAMKGIELGDAFENATKRGTQVHDEIFLGENGFLSRKTNRAAGLEGGISTGEPILVRVAMKPISTTLNPLKSVDIAAQKEAKTVYERSDFCALPRAVPIGESMLAIVLANALLEKLGGDSIDEIKPRFEALKQNRLSDLKLSNQPWQFHYDH